jgi:hypothetical protein
MQPQYCESKFTESQILRGNNTLPYKHFVELQLYIY